MILSVSKNFNCFCILYKKIYTKYSIKKKILTINHIHMSQYINQPSKRIYQPNFQYTMQQSNYYIVQTQRNPGVRQPSLNRNTNISSSMVIKPGKIQQNNSVKLRRQNSLKNCLEFKQNDPYLKNSNINVKIYQQQKQSTDYSSQYDGKNTYCNPLIVKRDKIMKDIGNLKHKNSNQTGQISTQVNKIGTVTKQNIRKAQYQQLSEKIIRMQNMMKDNSQKLIYHTSKIEKLEQYYQIQVSKGQHSRRHSRSISTASSSSPNFKQLSEIIRLIEQTKNYQMKNSEEYRKMIQQFRSTILQFRDQLNKTTKKQDLDSQILKIRQLVSLTSNNHQNNSLRKSSAQYLNNIQVLKNKKEYDTIQNQISILKQKLQKLEEIDISIKADLVKSNLREKLSLQSFQIFISQVDTKIQKLTIQNNGIINQNAKLKSQVIKLIKQNRFTNQFSFKKGNKYQGTGICFSVSNQLWHKKSNQLENNTLSHCRLYSSGIETNQSYCVDNNPIFSRNENNVQKLTDKRQGPLMRLNQKTYFIDRQGYLLDKDSYYLMNDNNQQIRLSDKQIQVLKRLNVMA